MADIIIDNFRNFNLKELSRIPILVVFNNTVNYVIRLFDLKEPTCYICIVNSLQNINDYVPKDMKFIKTDEYDSNSALGIFI